MASAGADGGSGGGAASKAAAWRADRAGGGRGDVRCATSRWDTPLVDGVPPTPRRGHTLAKLQHWRGGTLGQGDVEARPFLLKPRPPPAAPSFSSLIAANQCSDLPGPHDRSTVDSRQDDDEALLLLFGQSWLSNASTLEGRATYVNDVHVLHLGNFTWCRTVSRLQPHSCPRPCLTLAHTASLA